MISSGVPAGIREARACRELLDVSPTGLTEAAATSKRRVPWSSAARQSTRSTPPKRHAGSSPRFAQRVMVLRCTPRRAAHSRDEIQSGCVFFTASD